MPSVNDKLGAIARQQAKLDVFFRPKSVAVIGATDRARSVGRSVLVNLTATQFGGQVWAVNSRRSEVLGMRAFPSIAAVPAKVDLAIIVTPAPAVPDVVSECVAAGVRGAVIISAGFREAGEEGVALEREILARKGPMRIIGPNCLGVMCPASGLNATFANGSALNGNVALLSQSGALCTSILDHSLKERVGFSAFISTGSMLDVGWADLIDYLAEDSHTRSILIYMESIGDARAFLSAAREAALSKPILVIKAGRTEAAAKAAASHTGALAGSDEVLDAAFERSGVLRVDTIADLFNMAEVLGKQPRPVGSRLTILTNAGGPAVLATDALIGGGGQLTTLSETTVEKLNQLLPPHWSHGNPVDLLGDADADRYAQGASIVLEEPASDGLLVILTPQAMTTPAEVAERVAKQVAHARIPILTSWMGGADVALGRDIFNRAGIPGFDYPDDAARAFNYMVHYSQNLRALYETPALIDDADPPLAEEASRIVAATRASGRTLLTEHESKKLLSAWGIPTVRTELATSEREAVRLAREIGYPVAAKLHSTTVTHKSDVGGVRLGLETDAAVKHAWKTLSAIEGFEGAAIQPMVKTSGYELILGSSIDPQFGPVLLFGSGGTLVEVYRDRALALPPLNSTLAMRLMRSTKVFRALQGVRGRAPVDLEKLAALLVRFSRLVVECEGIQEIDINPLVVSDTTQVALDARVILSPAEPGRYPRPAIRPYPVQYQWQAQLRNATMSIRPIRPEDEPLMVRFHQSLSDESVYFRYFHYMNLGQRISHERLTRICFIDYDRQIALLGLVNGEVAGVARLTRLRATNAAEFALLIADKWQRKGVGTLLFRRLLEVAAREGISTMTGETLRENQPMVNLARKLGLSVQDDPEEGVVKIAGVPRVV
ncbi:MAG: bifunctional acetate--CoA ligase family protein/GNAT family N-acetyltransferase [Bryobacteraceae bacterium]